MITQSPQEVGRLLAFLELNRGSADLSHHEQSFTNAEKAILSYLHKRLEAIQSTKDLSKLPSEAGLQLDQACLNRAIDIFLFKLSGPPLPDQHDSETVCEELFRELNSNYYCFEQYSDMIRSYYRASREFQSG